MNHEIQISVCMAAYNGERYITVQLQSILCQLADGDEVIVVDDASHDGTVAIVESFHDERIRITRNLTNRGVVASFERAILEARGDVIFLSDQDDLWKPDKVSRFLQIFNDPKVTLALSDADIIDADGRMRGQSYFQARGGFVPGVMQNILRNHYIGCTMAFRRQILTYCLPFPKNLPMHDSWIGIVNDSFGKTAYIDEPLVLYRRHGQNVSRSGSLMQQVRWRLNLLVNIVKLRLRTKRGGAPISR
jgi:glycosyltransferase involved in cell wall biosynthesis